MSTPTQGSFVNRTKAIDRPNSYKVVKSINDAVYEPTGSNLNTAFTVSGTGYEVRGIDGGSITGGLANGTLYNVSLSYVSASSGATINLFR
jgi:hypothetical protein